MASICLLTEQVMEQLFFLRNSLQCELHVQLISFQILLADSYMCYTQLQSDPFDSFCMLAGCEHYEDGDRKKKKEVIFCA